MAWMEWEKPYEHEKRRANSISLKLCIRTNAETELPSMRLPFIYSKRNYVAYRKIGPEFVQKRNEKHRIGRCAQRDLNATVWLIVESFVFPFNVVRSPGCPSCAMLSRRAAFMNVRRNVRKNKYIAKKCYFIIVDRTRHAIHSISGEMIMRTAQESHPKTLLFNCLFTFRIIFLRSPMNGCDVAWNLHLNMNI